MKCPNCGNNVPDGSAFCNQCGTSLNSDIQCPSCNNLIPGNSVFCPKCGKMVRNDMAETETFNQKQERLRREQEAEAARLEQERKREEEMRLREARIKEQEARLAAERQAAEQSRKQKSFETPVIQDQDEDEDVVKVKSNFNRNIMLAISIIVGVILLLFLLRMCNGGSDRDNAPVKNDSIAAQTIDGQDPLALFNSEMSRSSFMGDGAQTAFAVLYPTRDGQKPSIIGVTFKSEPTGRSFYKIYRMANSGGSWNIELQHTQYINGRALTFDNLELMAEQNVVPRMVSVEGQDGLFFAYKNFPQGARDGNTGRISLCFYDVNGKKLTTVNYDGNIKTREDGRQYVYGKPLGLTGNDDPIAAKFLKQEVVNIKVIYNPTQEELAAEEEAQEKTEEEQNPENQNPDDKWNQENADNANAAKAGGEVAVKQQTTDKPMVKKDDMHKSINSSGFTVFSDNKGGVYGFNKDSRKYFKIYQSASGSPADIGFADSENGILNISAAEGKFQYNLKTNKLSAR